MKYGFGRPLAHIRAGAPICKGGRPNSCGRPPESSYPVPFSLLIRISYPVCTYLSPCST